jgi:hypothetical protein
MPTACLTLAVRRPWSRAPAVSTRCPLSLLRDRGGVRCRGGRAGPVHRGSRAEARGSRRSAALVRACRPSRCCRCARHGELGPRRGLRSGCFGPDRRPRPRRPHSGCCATAPARPSRWSASSRPATMSSSIGSGRPRTARPRALAGALPTDESLLKRGLPAAPRRFPRPRRPPQRPALSSAGACDTVGIPIRIRVIRMRRACGCALPRSPAADTRSHLCG